jgi:hypothetical protein
MKYNAFLVLMVIGIFGLSGCNMPIGSQAPTDVSPGLETIQTAAALTLEAQSGIGAATQLPAISSATPDSPTITPLPSSTPFPTASPTVSIPCDRAAFIKDVTIPDGMDFSPGDAFTKTWRLRNSGSCTWTTGYALVFDSGNSMGGAASTALTSSVAPNQTVDISVNLTAPGTPDTYRGNWKLRNASGAIFGLGNSSIPFYVEIDVVSAVGFSIEFENTHLCGGGVYATVEIVNTGIDFLKSAQIKVEDLDTSTTLYGPFTNTKAFMISPVGCPPGENDADPGLTYYIAVFIGTPPSGNTARFTVKLCTEDSLGGTCVEKHTDFVIP